MAAHRRPRRRATTRASSRSRGARATSTSRGGENVYPAQVEAAYHGHPAIREIAVVGIPDERFGEVGRAYVVLAPGAALDAEALRRFGRERLAAFKVPREFVAVETLPRTVTGKVQKYVLQRAGGGAAAAGPKPGELS